MTLRYARPAMPTVRTRVRPTRPLVAAAAVLFLTFAAGDGFGAGAFAEAGAVVAIYLGSGFSTRAPMPGRRGASGCRSTGSPSPWPAE